ncbi:MAG: DNA replication and repair protein RecF [Bdellovibrionales bacterium]|nr:DNA replication and repair protein RecF [Bdellovibrionales bacterium]
MSWLLKAEGCNFRNYNHFSFSPEKFNIFYGSNGQGKTSLLEALFIGLRGKTFRLYTSFSDVIQSEKNQASVQLRVKEERGESIISSIFQQHKSTGQVLYCGKKTGRAFLEKRFPILIFTVEKIDVIKKDAGERRNLVDELLSFHGKKNIFQRYIHSLKQKNALLLAYQKGEYSFSGAQKLLHVLNENFLQCSVELMKERLIFLNRLFQDVRKIVKELFSSSIPELGFLYDVSGSSITTAEEGGEILKKNLIERMDQELRAGRSLIGPHRQDIKFLFNQRDSRVFCSQGQQRLLILSLITSQINPLNPPFVFLDDVLSELDDKAQQNLLSFLEKTRAQVFLTSCKKVPWMTKNMSFFSIKNGTINPL